MKRITLKQVNSAIQKKYPGLMLTKGKGYFYLYSEDDTLAYKIALIYDNNIPVCHLHQQPLETWAKDVDDLMKEANEAYEDAKIYTKGFSKFKIKS